MPSSQPSSHVNLAIQDATLDAQSQRQALMTFSSALTSSSCYYYRWYLDSGASDHYWMQRSMFSEFAELSTPRRVFLGDKSSVLATGIGKILLHISEPSIVPCSAL